MFELTFMVNVFAPFYLTYKAFSEMQHPPKRVIITSSISHYLYTSHIQKIDYENLNFEKGGWTPYNAYGLSKLLVIMMTRGFKYCGLLPNETTMINMCPGTVNTKMLIAGWGPCGKDILDADDTFCLAT